MIVKTLLAAILFLNAVSLVVAQQNTGALKGTVTDQLASAVEFLRSRR